jgi:hypothetical protein
MTFILRTRRTSRTAMRMLGRHLICLRRFKVSQSKGEQGRARRSFTAVLPLSQRIEELVSRVRFGLYSFGTAVLTKPEFFADPPMTPDEAKEETDDIYAP